MADKQPSRLEELLDKALAEYVAADPRPKLEQRVAGYVRNQCAMRRAAWRQPIISWTAAGSVAVVATSLLWLGHQPGRVAPRPPEPEPYRTQSATARPASPAETLRAPVVFRREQKRWEHAALPKREVFPTVSPLSSEERALMTFAERPPKEIPPELTALDRPITPIRIAAIEIKPLDQITP